MLTVDKRFFSSCFRGVTFLHSSSKLNKVSPCEFIEIDLDRCTGCGLCAQKCARVVGQESVVLSIDHQRRKACLSKNTRSCVACGQCVACPQRAIRETEGAVDAVERAEAAGRQIVVQVGPAASVAMGELFGESASQPVVPWRTGAAARAAGFGVVETALGGDLTAIEESRELLSRLENGGPFPLLTSCCPAWHTLFSRSAPRSNRLLSTTRSPMLSLAPFLRRPGAISTITDPTNIFHVAVMPCTAKKKEAAASTAVDAVLTCREFEGLLRRRGITDAAWAALSPGEDDENRGEGGGFGSGSGAAQLFGVTGGVTEATLRTTCELGNSSGSGEVEIPQCRGTAGFRSATVQIGKRELRFAVVHGPSQVRKLIDRLRDPGLLPYHFIEVMLCQGGCVGGAGQPQHPARDQAAFLDRRVKALLAADRASPIRKSHHNPSVLALYADLLGGPGSPLARSMLHNPPLPSVAQEK